MSNSKKLFILLSFAIALLDGLFVSINHFYTKQSLNTTLQQESQDYYAIYNTVLESTYDGLSMQATLFAGDKRIQNLFLQGKKALEKEGGTTGGLETAKIRNELYQLVAKAWQDATKKFDVRQFHFHLGPGSLSFLRIHKPEKFGDRMDDLRFIIVDTNAEQTPRIGFETGRIYSGLRSVVPVFAWDETLNKEVYVGALEVGTSYKKLLQTIDSHLGIELSILLNNRHIKNTVWDEFITGKYNSNAINNCDCILEASSRPGQENLLEEIISNFDFENQLSNADNLSRIVAYQDNYYSVAFHPLRDYLGQKDTSRKDIGAVFIAKDITEIIASYNEELWFNILFGIITYIIIELLLLVTFINVTRHLTSRVRQQTEELLEQQRTIELNKIKYSNLAQAINSNYFFYTRTIDNQITHVSPSITKVLGFSEAEFMSNPVQYLPDNPHSNFVLEKAKQSFTGEGQNSFEVEIYNKSGRLQYLLVTETPKYDETKQLKLIEGLAQDMSQTRQDKMLLKLRCKILQMISNNKPANKILKKLALEIETIIQDINCAIMLVDQDNNTLKIGAAPTLPNEFKNALSGLNLDSQTCSCGIATMTAKRKIDSDILNSPDWEAFYPILNKTPYKACSSEPVLSSEAKVIATIDFYYNNINKPNQSDLVVLASATDLISILFENHNTK